MGTKFSITDNAVNQHSSNLDQSVAALNTQARAFLAAIEPLPGVWKGAAFQSWDQLTQRWNQAMADLNKSLTDIKQRVGSAGQLYDTYHSEQTSQLQQTMGSANWDSAKFRG
ncbi:WXG100 family type VII secretion target [Plantactinospora sp. GCM10030261]|uniref:WXG100 family type VII secretion target n=1 Tax=Plantactinospora sp. GCM10030261 TaxID=3273420 RepID=UPI00360A294A